jgi:hypothetical protein
VNGLHSLGLVAPEPFDAVTRKRLNDGWVNPFRPGPQMRGPGRNGTKVSELLGVMGSPVRGEAERSEK